MKSFDTFSPNIPEPEETLEPYNLDADVEEKTVRDQKSKNKKQNKTNKDRIKSENQSKKTTDSIFHKSVSFVQGETFRWILGLLMGFVAIYMAVAFISYLKNCFADQSEINNAAIGMAENINNSAGEGGARLSEFLINECFGLGSFVIVFWLMGMTLKHLVGKPAFKSVNFTIKCLVALITVSLIVGLMTIGLNSSVNWGGYHGRYVNEFIINFLGWTGAVILCLFMISCFVLICMRDVVNWVIKMRKARQEKKRIAKEQKAERLAKEKELEEMRRYEEKSESGRITDDQKSEKNESEDPSMKFNGEDSLIYAHLPELGEQEYSSYTYQEEDDDTNGKELSLTDHVDTTTANEENMNTDEIENSPALTNDESYEYVLREGAIDDKIQNEYHNDDDIEESQETSALSQFATNEIDPDVVVDNEERKAISDPMVVKVNTITQVRQERRSDDQGFPGFHPYKFPPNEILREGMVKISVDTQEQIYNKERIKQTLLSFDIPIVSIEATVGPTVTLYEIVPDKGIRISKIRNLVDDIALSLAAEGVRIIAPIPGRGTVGIEVANKEPQTVSMRTIIKSKAYQETKFKLPVALGSTISNEVYIADLAKMPHLLVAGATGQGKSVGLNAIITSLLYSKTPDELKFVMIDPKRVEFSLYAKIEKHYLAKIPDSVDAIITDTKKVLATLSSLCVEMDNRYILLQDAQCKTIVEYNAKIKEHMLNPLEGHRFLPYIVIIVDEFSDLIMTAGKEVEMPIARLAQLARAVGIHVIIATQRPSTNVITGMIKANFPVRIAFRVTSGIDSKTILDTTGAQQLVGRGDMLINEGSQMVRVQCAFVDTPEVEEVCEYISKQPYAQGAYLLPEPIVGDDEIETEMGDTVWGEKDSKFDEAARFVVSSNSASASGLQRRFKIGYNRAANLIEEMAAVGIVGPAQGGKPRSVLINDLNLLETILSSR